MYNCLSTPMPPRQRKNQDKHQFESQTPEPFARGQGIFCLETVGIVISQMFSYFWSIVYIWSRINQKLHFQIFNQEFTTSSYIGEGCKDSSGNSGINETNELDPLRVKPCAGSFECISSNL